DVHKSFLILIAGTATLWPASAQDIQRRASVSRGGMDGSDGCMVDVVVDGSAEIQIRGDTATMRNLSGGQPQFRQFECSRPVPQNPIGFRFTDIDGRGRQELVRMPRDGSPTVVRIDDPQGGQGEYRFQIVWGNPVPQQRDPGDRGYNRNSDPDRDHGNYMGDRDRFFQGNGWHRNLFQRVREDVEHLQHTTFPFSGDQSRLSRTIFELNELQGKMAQGRYDEHELSDVMDALVSVLRNNRLSGRDRDILTDDLDRMRQFREHHDEWG